MTISKKTSAAPIQREIIAKIINPVSVFFQIIVASEFLFRQ